MVHLHDQKLFIFAFLENF